MSEIQIQDANTCLISTHI